MEMRRRRFVITVEGERSVHRMPLVQGGVVLIAWLVLVGFAGAQTPLGGAFTYQGQLQANGEPVNDAADFEFTLWDALEDGNQVGAVVAVNDVAVVGGLFAAELDFGPAVFDGNARWLEVAVRSPAGQGAFTALTPRQAVTATPYALQTRGVFVDEDERVGIHTTTPVARLEVQRKGGEQEVARFVDPGSLSQLRFQASNYRGEIQGWDGGTDVPGSLVLNGAGGRVGIGTAPAVPVHMHSASLWPTLRLESSSNAGTWLQLLNTSVGGKTWSVISSGEGNGEGAGRLLFHNGNTRMILDSSSLAFRGSNFRIGVGTDSPEDTLHLANGAMRFPNGSRQTVAYQQIGSVQTTVKTGVMNPNSRIAVSGTVAGASPGDLVIVTPVGDVPYPLVLFGAYCPSADQYRFLLHNVGNSVVETQFDCRVTVIRP